MTAMREITIPRGTLTLAQAKVSQANLAGVSLAQGVRWPQCGRVSSASKRENAAISEGVLSSMRPSHSTQAWD